MDNRIIVLLDNDDQPLPKPPPKPVEVIPVWDSDDDQTLVLISSEDHTSPDVDNDDEEITSPVNGGGSGDINDTPSDGEITSPDEDRASPVIADKKRKRKRPATARPKTYRKWIRADELRLVRMDGKLRTEFGKTVDASKLFQELQLQNPPLSRLDLNADLISRKRQNLKAKFKKNVLNRGHHKRIFCGDHKSHEEELYQCCREAWPHIDFSAIMNGSDDDDLN